MLSAEKLNDITSLANKMRISAIQMGHAVEFKSLHFGSALSAMEILACLYSGVMDVDSKNPAKFPRDIFITSKAHCVLATYTVLAHTGFFPVKDLETFEQDDSELCGHPVMNINRGIEFSGGSLGMSLSQAVGICLGFKLKNLSNHVFVLLGDGELDEGSNWEAIMSATHFKLDNLVAIIDRNYLQLDGTTEKVMDLKDLNSKFNSFGFDTVTVDGHNVSELYPALMKVKNQHNEKPKAVIANTVKGKGVSFMENKVEWHYSMLTAEQYEIAMKDLLRGGGDSLHDKSKNLKNVFFTWRSREFLLRIGRSIKKY